MSSTTRTKQIYNLISVVMLVLTGFVIVGAVIVAVLNPGGGGGVVGDQPTRFVIPSETPTLPGPTPNATMTITPTSTITDTPTITTTAMPSRTPTPTPTASASPTLTTTITLTPSETPTRTPTASLTPTSDSPYSYTGSISYKKNFANAAGCDWTGIAGTVKNLSGSHQTGFTIHVWGSGVDQRVNSGGAPDYGASGWEQYLANTPNDNTYNVQLESADGVYLSAVISVKMKDNCDKNLALVDFKQVK